MQNVVERYVVVVAVVVDVVVVAAVVVAVVIAIVVVVRLRRKISYEKVLRDIFAQRRLYMICVIYFLSLHIVGANSWELII